MKVARNTTHALRHDWLLIGDERGKIRVSLMAMRNRIEVHISLDGKEHEAELTARQLAAILAKGLPE